MAFLFRFLVFPGAAFLMAGGVLAAFADRKITARMQSRRGPPTLQPLYDLIKLVVKQPRSVEPRGRGLSRIFPWIGLTASLCGAFMIWQSVLFPSAGFRGDYFIAAAFLAVSSFAQVMGFTAGRSRLRTARQANFFMTAELPFFIAAGVPFLQAGGTFRLGGLSAVQSAYGMAALSPPGAIAFAVAFITSFAKLRFAPFDAADTGLDAYSGPGTGYSGIQLALHLSARWVLLFAMPALLSQLFLGGLTFRAEAIPEFLAKYGLLFCGFQLIRTISAKMPLSAAFKWHLGPLTAAALVSVALSFVPW
jgi:NADH-quinone oxidoreductase subunit H